RPDRPGAADSARAVAPRGRLGHPRASRTGADPAPPGAARGSRRRDRSRPTVPRPAGAPAGPGLARDGDHGRAALAGDLAGQRRRGTASQPAEATAGTGPPSGGGARDATARAVPGDSAG